MHVIDVERSEEDAGREGVRTVQHLVGKDESVKQPMRTTNRTANRMSANAVDRLVTLPVSAVLSLAIRFLRYS